MTEPREGAWPRPFLLQLYSRAVEEGCIRVKLDGDHEKFKSLKASFYRLRRRKDAQSVALMRPEYYMTTMLWEEDKGMALIIYDQLPDGQALPGIESVEHKHKMEMPTIKPSHPHIPGVTPVEEPEEFDATAHVAEMLGNIDFSDGEDDAASEL